MEPETRTRHIGTTWSTVGVLLRRHVAWSFVALYVVGARSLSIGFGRTLFCDTAQFLLAILLVFACWNQLRSGNTRTRAFWALMGFGGALWAGSQLAWTYNELWNPQSTVAPCVGDFLLFMHVVPMTAALLFAPHRPSGLSLQRTLSILMLTVWWIYLYSFYVLPWQLISVNSVRYHTAFTTLYAIENGVTICGLAILAYASSGSWRKIYCQILVFWIVYSCCSTILDKVIALGRYQTGSLYDLLFICPIACLCHVILAHSQAAGSIHEEMPHHESEWVTRIAMGGLLSVPVIGMMAVNSGSTQVADTRIKLSFIVVLVISALLLTKLRLLGKALVEVVNAQALSVKTLERARQELEFQASHDPMTGALNRGALYRDIERALPNDQNQRARLAVLMIDLDHFKQINDTYGHSTGDLAIQLAIANVRKHTRETDIVGRYGGEEFVVVLKDCDQSTALNIAERIRSEVERDSLLLDGKIVRFTLSIGITTCNSREEVDSMLKRADIALFEAKRAGRNRVELCFEPA